MPNSIQVDGLATIKIASPAGGTLEELGLTINGVEITEQIFTEEVKGDENGGDAGPPIDVQYLGEMHVIRITMTKYDETVLNKIRAGLAGGTAGTVGTSGTLYMQGTSAFRLLIHTPNRPRNYINVIFQEPKEVNKGTIHSKATIIGRAYYGANKVMYNTSTT
jgi:hypothetical protein